MTNIIKEKRTCIFSYKICTNAYYIAQRSTEFQYIVYIVSHKYTRAHTHTPTHTHTHTHTRAKHFDSSFETNFRSTLSLHGIGLVGEVNEGEVLALIGIINKPDLNMNTTLL